MKPANNDSEMRAHIVRRALTHHNGAGLLAAPLWDYATSQGLSWKQLADTLHISEDGLYQLALCRPPRSDQWQADVQAITAGLREDGVVIDTDALAALLRPLEERK